MGENTRALSNIKEKLKNILAHLETLEQEKKDIIYRFENATEEDGKAIKEEMAQSEEKFVLLCDEVTTLLQEVKKLKEDIKL